LAGGEVFRRGLQLSLLCGAVIHGSESRGDFEAVLAIQTTYPAMMTIMIMMTIQIAKL
jgi:hypothetical protein